MMYLQCCKSNMFICSHVFLSTQMEENSMYGGSREEEVFTSSTQVKKPIPQDKNPLFQVSL